jgi:hypothetical protein
LYDYNNPSDNFYLSMLDTTTLRSTIVKVNTTVDFAGQEVNKYYVVGYNKKFSTLSGGTPNPNLVIYGSFDSTATMFPGLDTTYYPMALVLWTGSNVTSKILYLRDELSNTYEMRSWWNNSEALLISHGGTGATTAPDALVNLGAAPINSPTFTGEPKAPTPAADDNSTKVATTAFVQTENALKAPLESPTFTGDPKVPTPDTSDNDTSIASTAFVQAAITAKAAPIDSPAFTGTPTTPTPGASAPAGQIANVGWVRNNLPAGSALGSGIQRVDVSSTSGFTVTLTQAAPNAVLSRGYSMPQQNVRFTNSTGRALYFQLTFYQISTTSSVASATVLSIVQLFLPSSSSYDHLWPADSLPSTAGQRIVVECWNYN